MAQRNPRRGARFSVPGTARYEHFRMLRDEDRGRTWFEGRFVATESDVIGFECELTWRIVRRVREAVEEQDDTKTGGK